VYLATTQNNIYKLNAKTGAIVASRNLHVPFLTADLDGSLRQYDSHIQVLMLLRLCRYQPNNWSDCDRYHRSRNWDLVSEREDLFR
jgi:hypothetical protein